MTQLSGTSKAWTSSWVPCFYTAVRKSHFGSSSHWLKTMKCETSTWKDFQDSWNTVHWFRSWWKCISLICISIFRRPEWALRYLQRTGTSLCLQSWFRHRKWILFSTTFLSLAGVSFTNSLWLFCGSWALRFLRSKICKKLNTSSHCHVINIARTAKQAHNLKSRWKFQTETQSLKKSFLLPYLNSKISQHS